MTAGSRRSAARTSRRSPRTWSRATTATAARTTSPGREALTLAEIAATLAAGSGKRIEYVDETLAEARSSRASYGAPDWQVDAWISTYTAIAAGELAAVSDTVERVTGRPAQSLAEFCRAHPGALAHVH